MNFLDFSIEDLIEEKEVKVSYTPAHSTAEFRIHKNGRLYISPEAITKYNFSFENDTLLKGNMADFYPIKDRIVFLISPRELNKQATKNNCLFGGKSKSTHKAHWHYAVNPVKNLAEMIFTFFKDERTENNAYIDFNLEFYPVERKNSMTVLTAPKWNAERNEIDKISRSFGENDLFGFHFVVKVDDAQIHEDVEEDNIVVKEEEVAKEDKAEEVSAESALGLDKSAPTTVPNDTQDTPLINL
jgi:hypothetical protein